MFMVLSSSWPKSLQEFTRFIWRMQTERRVAANHQTLPIDLGCGSAENYLLPSTSTIDIVIITQPISRYSFCLPMEGGRLNRLRHCSKGPQPVPKAAYCNSCCYKHNHPQCEPASSHTIVRRANHSATETCKCVWYAMRAVLLCCVLEQADKTCSVWRWQLKFMQCGRECRGIVLVWCQTECL